MRQSSGATHKLVVVPERTSSVAHSGCRIGRHPAQSGTFDSVV